MTIFSSNRSLPRTPNRVSSAGVVGLRAIFKHAVIALVLAVYLQGLSRANPLGITVCTPEEAKSLHRAMGVPGLGPRKNLVVVKEVDPSGPCGQSVPKGFALQRLSGVPVRSIDDFANITSTFNPGMAITVEGLYVSPQGVWRSGTATVVIPSPKPTEAETNEPSTTAKATPIVPSPSQPRSERSRLEPERRNDRAEAKVVDPPYVPFYSEVEGYDGYGGNDDRFAANDYTKGPHGEKLFKLYCSGTRDGSRTCEVIEGFVADKATPDATLSAPDLQAFLFEAYKDNRFRRHGRNAVWYLLGDISTVRQHEASSEDTEQAKSLTAAAGLPIKPREFSYWFDDERHGLTTKWSGEGEADAKILYVHGLVHSLAEIRSKRQGEKSRTSYRFGVKHGNEEIFFLNGKRKGQRFWLNGEQEGQETVWFENGVVEWQVTYRSGDRYGEAVYRYSNGRKRSVNYYNKDRMVVDELAWDTEGNPVPGVTVEFDDRRRGFVTTEGESGRPKGHPVYESGRKEGEIVAAANLESMRLMSEPFNGSIRFQDSFDKLFKPMVLARMRDLEEYPKGSNGFEFAKGFLETYIPIMAKHVSVP
jgi:antitoxin component YwqK of YwqJK toxin-antitoxin module